MPSDRLALFTLAADLDDVLAIRKPLLRRFPRIALHSDLVDAHLYIVSRWALSVLPTERTSQMESFVKQHNTNRRKQPILNFTFCEKKIIDKRNETKTTARRVRAGPGARAVSARNSRARSDAAARRVGRLVDLDQRRREHRRRRVRRHTV